MDHAQAGRGVAGVVRNRAPYTLGIDIGTDWSAAAVFCGGAVDVVDFGDAQAIPTVAHIDGDEIAVGFTALRRDASGPSKLVRDFKTYGGDASSPASYRDAARCERLLKRTVAFIYREVVRQRGLAPSSVMVTVASGWKRDRHGRFTAAVKAALPVDARVDGVSDAIATAVYNAATRPVREHDLLLVIDVGASSTGAAAVGKTADSVHLLGVLDRDDSISTRAVDALLARHVEERIGGDWDACALSGGDVSDPVVAFRAQVARAKERLSATATVTITSEVPDAVAVEVTRHQFDDLIRPLVDQTVQRVDELLSRFGDDDPAAASLLITGGGSLIAGFAQAVATASGVALFDGAHPKFAACCGAALVAAKRARLAAPPEAQASTVASAETASAATASEEPSVAEAPDVFDHLGIGDLRWLRGVDSELVDVDVCALTGISRGELTFVINDGVRRPVAPVTPLQAAGRARLPDRRSLPPRAGIAAVVVALLAGGAFAASRRGDGSGASAAGALRPTASVLASTALATVLAANVTAAPEPATLHARIVGPTAAVVGSPVEFVDDSTGDPAKRTWTAGTTTGTASKFLHAFPEAGLAKVKLVVERDGATSEATMDVVVSAPAGPLVARINGPRSGAVGVELIFQDLSDGGPKVREWTVDGTVVGSDPTLSFAFAAVGPHRVQLSIERDGSHAMGDLEVDIVDAPATTVRPVITGPTFARVGSDIVFTDTTLGNVSTRAWKVDGAPRGSARTLTVRFDVPGTYLVALTATNGTATAITTLAVVVESRPVDAVAVPNVIGLGTEVAGRAIADARLVVGEVTSVFDETVAVGFVVRTSPTAGSLIAVGDAVSIAVSLGRDRVLVPPVVGLNQTDAVSSIGRSGLAAVVSARPHAAVPEGSVVASIPDTGTSLQRGATVTVVVSSGPQIVAVPVVVGLLVADGRSSIVSRGLVTTIRSVTSTVVPAGRIVSTDPPAGREVRSGATVTMLVSTGPRQVAVPFVIDLGRTVAEAQLTAAGFVVVVEQRSVPAATPVGIVVESVPAAGVLVNEASTVTIMVSVPRRIVPNVVDLTQGSAFTALAAAGLSPVIVASHYSGSTAVGSVISQSPAAETEQPGGTTVGLVVSLGPPPGPGTIACGTTSPLSCSLVGGPAGASFTWTIDGAAATVGPAVTWSGVTAGPHNVGVTAGFVGGATSASMVVVTVT